MHFILRVLLIVQICIHQCQSEWVKISQISKENKNESNTTKTIEMDITEPSPEWIEYQKERFSGTNISQRLIVSGESHLKTSAEIIVPAKINDSDQKRNKIVRTKTKISVEDSASEAVTPSSTEASKQPKPTKDTTFDKDLKFPSFMGFLNFLTYLQRGLLTKTSYGIVDKIKVLKNVRDQIMMNIEERLYSMFPKSRQKRGLTDESSFHFPSEAALMSISFLTFSVFLIKLVLQVIHIIKSKHYTYTGMTMNNMNTMTMGMRSLNARRFGDNQEDLDVLRKVTTAIKINPFDNK